MFYDLVRGVIEHCETYSMHYSIISVSGQPYLANARFFNLMHGSLAGLPFGSGGSQISQIWLFGDPAGPGKYKFGLEKNLALIWLFQPIVGFEKKKLASGLYLAVIWPFLLKKD